MKKNLQMKSVISTVFWCIFFIVMALAFLNLEYDKLDAYNKASHDFQWVSRLEDDAYHVRRMGKGSEYYIGVSTDHGAGVIDRNGKEILPTDYEAVDYRGGDYIAAITMYNWMLFDTKGKEAASFNRISLPYAYAGDRYFIRYGDDHIEDMDDGFTIIDAVSGEEVREYEDFYNAVRLDDGNWYISRTPDVDGIAGRWVWSQLSTYETTTVTVDEEGNRVGRAAETPNGFFTDEKCRPLFDEKAYRLICQGDGLYVAEVMEKGSAAQGNEDVDAVRGDIVVLDEKGQQFTIEDEALLKRIRYYEKNGDCVIGATTVFKAEEGNIGFRALKTDGKTLYLDKTGKPIKVEKDDTEEAEAAIREQLSPVFSEVELLPGTDHVLVNGALGCGIIRWEGGRQ